MNNTTSALADVEQSTEEELWSIAVNSIGTAGVRMVSALRAITPLSDNRLAELLFQAPSVLVDGLTLEVAEHANKVLLSAGLETQVLNPGESVEPGDALHEIALVVCDISKITDLLTEIVKLVGVSIKQARTMLCTSPTVLMGKVSAKTVEACRQRFVPLGAEIDVARADQAVYDVFLGQCSPLERNHVCSALRRLSVELSDNQDQPLVALGLHREKAEKLWNQFSRNRLPLRLINRNFERFDVTLDAAPDSEPLIQYLIASTGMTEAVAHKVITRTPIVIRQQISFTQMTECIEAINQLGGTATGQLLIFQTFSLRVHRVGNQVQSLRILELIANCSHDEAARALQQGLIEGPLTHLQARWLQWELKQAGTETRRVLR